MSSQPCAAPPEPRYASLAKAAEYLGGDISQLTTRRWITSSRITGYRIGAHLVRVDLNEIEDKVISLVPPAGNESA